MSALLLPVLLKSVDAFIVDSSPRHYRRTTIGGSNFQHPPPLLHPALSSSSSSSSSSDLVDELLSQIRTSSESSSSNNDSNSNSNNNNDNTTKAIIEQLVVAVDDATTSINKPASDISNDGAVDFESLIGYYNVSSTITARANDNPVGGKWTRGGTTRHLWVIRRTLQHLLPPRSTGGLANTVAQAVNVIRLDLLFGWIPIWIVLRGDAVPLLSEEEEEPSTVEDRINNNKNKDKDNKDNKKPSPPLLVPGLSPRAVRAYFDKPRIAIGRRRKGLVFSFGPTSSVVLDTPYADDRVRIGRGGTSGTWFVFSRLDPTKDVQGTNDWKWVLENDNDNPQSTNSTSINSTSTAGEVITQRTVALVLGVTSAFGAVASRRLLQGVAAKLAIGTSVVSTIGLVGVLLSTGGIETRGDTYAPGKKE